MHGPDNNPDKCLEVKHQVTMLNYKSLCS